MVDGFRNEDDPDHMDAYQYFYDADGNETGHMPVGEMHWHAQNHQHWHFEDFARYRLLNADQTKAVRSTKQSFCLANTDAVDYTVEGCRLAAREHRPVHRLRRAGRRVGPRGALVRFG